MKTSYRALIAILMLAVATTTSAGAGINAKSNPDDISWSKQITYPGTNGDVYAIVEDASGNIIVGGDFYTAGNVETNSIACWHPSTSTWSSLGTGIGAGNGNFTGQVYDIEKTALVSCTITINDGDVYTNSQNVTLTLTSSGATEMRFMNGGGAVWSSWEPVAATRAWTLISGDGAKSVDVEFRNAALDVTTASDTITLDQTPPAGSVVIADGATAVNYNPIELAVSATDDTSGVASMRFSNDGTAWSDPETYATPSNWWLTAGEGTKTVFVKFTDNAGNESEGIVGTDTIEVDTTPPSPPNVTGPELTNDNTPTWSWLSGGGDGIGQYRIQLNGTAEESWTLTSQLAFTPTDPLADKQTHALYVQERDVAGNWSVSGTWLIDIDSDVVTAPYVSGVTPINEATPLWTWISGGGLDQYRYQLSGEDEAGWTETTATSWEPSEPLAEGVYTLYVQQRLSELMWSESGSFAITIDLTSPAAPTVTSSGTPRTGLPDITNSLQPVWTWTSGGGGNGTYRYQLDGTDEGGWTETTDIAFAPADPLAEGVHTMYVQERDEGGNWSESGERAVEIDATRPNPPVVSAPARTSSLRPVWTWVSGGNGNGTYRYQLDSEDEGGWTVTMALAFVPESDLAEGSYTLYVQERDDASNWSASGSATVSVEPNAPGAPVVTSPAVTNNPQPTWTWVSGGGAGNYRYQLDSEAGDWTATTETSFTLDPLDEGFHTLYVQEASATEVWSASGSSTTLVDFTAPNAPVVTGPGITADATPTWSWTPDGGGNGTFRYQLDSTTGAWTETTDTQFTPDANLGTGPHILFVEERDDAGNWSASGSWTIVIAPNAPNPPVVSGVSPTADTTPTWTWTSGGGGNGAFRYQLDATGGAWTQTTNTTYTSASPLSEGPHTLYVQESNTVGDWSVSGSFTIVVVFASSVDSDSDGLTDAEEAAIGTNPENPDTDGDGMDDGYEHAHGLDPLNPEDAFLDTDSDGFTNFEEYLLRSDPLDPDSPRDTFFISAEGGVDVSTGGTESAPWRTINYALDQVAPAEQVPVTLVILPGTYYEGVALKPHVMLAGAESQEKPLIAGSVIAAASTELRRLALAPVQLATSGTLLDITSVEVVVKEVDFSGAGFTGIRFNSPNGTGALIEECVFSGLGTGIELLDALPTIRRCVFDGISADAIVVRAQMSGEKAEGNGSLGEEGNANSGYNTFAATIDGYAVINERTDESLVMEINDWDTDDLTEIAGRIGGTGDVDFDPPLTKGAGIMAASVFCSVWNAADKSPIDNASVQLSPGAFNPVTQNSAGVYTFACVIPGDWTFTVSAPACTDASQSAHVEAAETKNLLFPMQSSTPTEGEGEDEDEDDDNPPLGCFGG